jgi:rhodanese-related sulfurtransferase
VQTVTAQDVKHMWDRGEDFLLVNTLPAHNFPQTKIPGAVNIPEQDDGFADHVLNRAGSKEKTVVVYCASSECESSASAARKLLDAGFEDVFVFEEGAAGWQQFMKARKGAGLSKW